MENRFPSHGQSGTILKLLILLLIFHCAIISTFGFTSPRTPTPTEHCMKNLRNIDDAFNQYEYECEAVNKPFPICTDRTREPVRKYIDFLLNQKFLSLKPRCYSAEYSQTPDPYEVECVHEQSHSLVISCKIHGTLAEPIKVETRNPPDGVNYALGLLGGLAFMSLAILVKLSGKRFESIVLNLVLGTILVLLSLVVMPQHWSISTFRDFMPAYGFLILLLVVFLKLFPSPEQGQADPDSPG